MKRTLFLNLLMILFTAVVANAQMALHYDTNLSTGTTVELPLYGTVNVTVDWGDGTPAETIATTGNHAHTYASEGNYTVSITGTLTHLGDNSEPYCDQKKLVSVSSWDGLGITDFSFAFYSANNLTTVPTTLPPNVTNFAEMFNNNVGGGNSVFNSDVSQWDVSKGTNFRKMFFACLVFNSDVSQWNVSQGTNFAEMFVSCENFNSDVSQWDVSSGTNFRGMFYYCSVFNSDVSQWDVSNGTSFASMFYEAKKFNQNLGAWNLSSVIEIGNSYGELMYMLYDTKLDCKNYSATLNGWAANPNTPDNLNCSGANLQYNVTAKAAHNTLINDKGWTITGDTYDAECGSEILEINKPSALEVCITPATTTICKGESAELTLTITGGTPAPSYSITYNGTTVTADNTAGANETPRATYTLNTGALNTTTVFDETKITVSDTNGCTASYTCTATVTVSEYKSPTFAPIARICYGGTFSLPTTSQNGISGAWTPAVNNTLTTEYTFTPNAGQCAITTKMTVVVQQATTPTFAQIAPICQGGSFSLPATSQNGISGTWSPAVNNTLTTEYTFTPNAGQCATTTKMTVEVNENTVAISGVSVVCLGSTTQLTATPEGGSWSASNTNATVNNNGLVSGVVSGTVEITYTHNGCTAEKTIRVATEPVATYTFVTPDIVCKGNTAAIKMSGSELGVEYQLKNADGTNVGGVVAGTGEAIYFTTEALETATSFQVVAHVSELKDNSCTKLMDNQPTVNVAEPPTFTAIVSDINCFETTPADGSLKVQPSGNAPFTIQLYKNGELQKTVDNITKAYTFTGLDVGEYGVKVIDSNGCCATEENKN